MSETKENPSDKESDREVVSTRVIKRPRELIWEAWTHPKHLAQWWGPNGFTNTIHEFDLKPGGHWRLTMHGPDGTNYENESVFLEVVKPVRIVFKHLEPVHGFRMTMELDEALESTRVTWRMLFESAAECARVKSFVSEANQQNFDRLETQLAKMKSAG